MILSSQTHTASDFAQCGKKAQNLARLLQEGFCVPAFLCLAPEDLQRPDKIFSALRNAGIKEPYAVRSSAQVEDGERESYAGQFTTFLHVNATSLLQCIRNCFLTKTVLTYTLTGERQAVQSVILQEMIDAELSGVMFTKNPMGIISESVIVVGKGIGSNVVEDKIAVNSYYHNAPDDISYHSSQEGAPTLSNELREQLILACNKLEHIFGKGLDVEFAVKEDGLYYLQVRKITTLSYDQPIILDNSNIVESYPGTTTTLTADFVSRQYASIFKGVVAHLSGNQKLSQQYSEVFDHMVEYYNGRMYYQITNWYGVISFLPFSKKILPVWREMLGVAHDDDLPTTYRISPFQRTSIALHTLYYFIKAPKKMLELDCSMQTVEAQFHELCQKKRTIEEFRHFYDSIVALVMNKWDYTLINDMYTFIHTGLFRAIMKRRGAKEDELQKAVADLSYLASLQPVKKLLNLALELKQNGKSAIFSADLEAYIAKYGDRSIGELKLETATYREKPDLLMKQIEQYAISPKLEELLFRLEAPIDKKSMKGIAGFFLKRAKRGIEGREKSRMDRTRLFGFARRMFLQVGWLLQEQGRIEEQRDIFYLTIEEMFDTEHTPFQSIVSQRKILFDSYGGYPAFSRIIFDKKIVQKPFRGIMNVQQSTNAALHGTPCSDGIVKGEVLLVKDLDNLGDVTSKILVTYSTDPGWAFLLANAAGLVSEKGSILSHTAIIARELHTPMIVAVNGAMTRLKDGDVVEMDCSTGFITVVRHSV